MTIDEVIAAIDRIYQPHTGCHIVEHDQWLVIKSALAGRLSDIKPDVISETPPIDTNLREQVAKVIVETAFEAGTPPLHDQLAYEIADAILALPAMQPKPVSDEEASSRKLCDDWRSYRVNYAGFDALSNEEKAKIQDIHSSGWLDGFSVGHANGMSISHEEIQRLSAEVERLKGEKVSIQEIADSQGREINRLRGMNEHYKHFEKLWENRGRELSQSEGNVFNLRNDYSCLKAENEKLQAELSRLKAEGVKVDVGGIVKDFGLLEKDLQDVEDTSLYHRFYPTLRKAATLITQLQADITAARADLAKVEERTIERCVQALGESAWKHEGDDAYSQGMDKGALHQLNECLEAIRSLPRQEGK